MLSGSSVPRAFSSAWSVFVAGFEQHLLHAVHRADFKILVALVLLITVHRLALAGASSLPTSADG
jgi:hypothetical protein